MGERLRGGLRILRLLRFEALITVVIAATVGTAFLGTFPPFLTVMSGSMEPTYHPGDVAIMQSLHGQRPRISQVVQINVPKEYQARYSYPSRVVHRVVKIEDGWVITKGDNVGDPDPFKTRVGAVNRFNGPPPTTRIGEVRLSSSWRAPLGGLLIFLVLPMREAIEARQTESDRQGVTLDQLVVAIGEYGHHLESHTDVVKGMSEASRSLAAIVARFEGHVPAMVPDSAEPAESAEPIEPTEPIEPRRARPLRAKRERPLRANRD